MSKFFTLFPGWSEPFSWGHVARPFPSLESLGSNFSVHAFSCRPWSSTRFSPVAISLLLSSRCRSSISTAIKGPPISIFIVGVILTQFLFALSSWMQISFLVFHLKKFFAFLFFVLLSSSVFIVFAGAKGVGWYGAFINPLNCYCLLRQLCYFSFRNGTTTMRTHNITRFAAAPVGIWKERLNHFQNIHRFSASLRKMYSTTSNTTTSTQEQKKLQQQQ